MVQFWKQFAGSDIASKRDVFWEARLKLTGLYCLIVAVIVCGFSLFLYQSLQHNLRDASEDDFADVQSHHHFTQQTLDSLQRDIFLADLLILCAAAGLSYALAGWTLRPVQRSNKAQQEFAANASHELRTPLAVMKNEVEVLLRNKAPTQALVRSTLGSNLEELQHMSDIVEDLLLIARTGNNEVSKQFSDVDLSKLLHDAVSSVRQIVEEKNIHLHVPEPVPLTVRGDTPALKRAFLNVLRNSVRHTPPGGSITVGLQKENAQAIVRITDTGTGIDPRHLAHVFERFYKASDSDGTGLGLSIVKEIVEHHGGDLAIESELGKGTTVTIRLPCA